MRRHFAGLAAGLSGRSRRKMAVARASHDRAALLLLVVVLLLCAAGPWAGADELGLARPNLRSGRLLQDARVCDTQDKRDCRDACFERNLCVGAKSGECFNSCRDRCCRFVEDWSDPGSAAEAATAAPTTTTMASAIATATATAAQPAAVKDCNSQEKRDCRDACFERNLCVGAKSGECFNSCRDRCCRFVEDWSDPGSAAEAATAAPTTTTMASAIATATAAQPAAVKDCNSQEKRDCRDACFERNLCVGAKSGECFNSCRDRCCRIASAARPEYVYDFEVPPPPTPRPRWPPPGAFDHTLPGPPPVTVPEGYAEEFEANYGSFDVAYEDLMPGGDEYAASYENFNASTVENYELGFLWRLFYEADIKYEVRGTDFGVMCPEFRCREGDMIATNHNNPNADYMRWEFQASSEIPGTGRIRTRTADLCVTMTETEEDNYAIALHRCDLDDEMQLFLGFSYTERFLLHPYAHHGALSPQCVTMLHHPRAKNDDEGERIIDQPCHKALRTETAYWVAEYRPRVREDLGLRDYGCTHPGGRCGECMGDCDVDRDCLGDLRCFQRNEKGWRTGHKYGWNMNPWAEVPGCSGVGEFGRDYCYDASKGPAAATAAVQAANATRAGGVESPTKK